jgi:hypothetical protein
LNQPERTRSADTRPSNGHSAGAHAVEGGGHRKRRLGWLWWLLGLMALAAIIALLVGLIGGDDSDERTATPSGQNGQSGQSAGAGSTTAAGNLSAGDVKLLPVPSGGFAGSVGDSAQGRDVVVQSVVRGEGDPNALEGFWVGSSAQDRVYVEWGGDVGTDEATYRPKVGEKVNLTGPVRPAPEDPAQTLNLKAADADLVRSQGAYINADDVTPAQG